MEPIEEFMMNLQRGGFNMMKRVIHRMEHQDKIAGFVRDLDHAFQTFQVRYLTMICSTVPCRINKYFV